MSKPTKRTTRRSCMKPGGEPWNSCCLLSDGVVARHCEDHLLLAPYSVPSTSRPGTRVSAPGPFLMRHRIRGHGPCMSQRALLPQRMRVYTRGTENHCNAGKSRAGRSRSAVVRMPFTPSLHAQNDEVKPDVHRASWFKREDAAITHGHSSLFFLAHDTLPPPSATCLQGHDLLPGETTCIHGHPIG